MRVAFVCTGNRFRSPLAAALFAAGAGAEEVPVHVASLGTLELGPVPALPEALEVARSMGVDLSRHRARTVAGSNLERFELESRIKEKGDAEEIRDMTKKFQANKKMDHVKLIAM